MGSSATITHCSETIESDIKVCQKSEELGPLSLTESESQSDASERVSSLAILDGESDHAASGRVLERTVRLA